MPELRNIPLTYKEGIYSITDFNKDIDSENAISFDYDTQYQILTYTIPIDERLLTLYSVSEDELIRTLRAVYNKEGTLSKVTATLNTPDRRSINLRSEMRMPLLNKFNNAQMPWQGFLLSTTLTRRTWITMQRLAPQHRGKC